MRVELESANQAYGEHRDSCYLCGAVDLQMRPTEISRCPEGQKLVRSAAQESRIKGWKLKITSEDLLFLEQVGIENGIVHPQIGSRAIRDGEAS
jgi:hypothetical protein